ncbi:hypothetical protein AGMMS50255_1790 [Spirochaetia bacterium]|nr:hypothetical protein AGMMS50255_1790 [Spirochaetia bacterium]
MIKINIKSTRDWNDNYKIRNDIFEYVASHNIVDDQEEYISFIQSCNEKNNGNPVVSFYTEKIKIQLSDSDNGGK